jgi:hypothetical protein
MAANDAEHGQRDCDVPPEFRDGSKVE